MLPTPFRSAPICWWRIWASGGTFLLRVAFRHVICGFYLIFLPNKLPSKIQKLPPDRPVRGFPGVWKLRLLGLPSWDRSPSLTLLSFFLSVIFCPTSFQRQWAAFLGAWCPLLAIRSCFVKFAQRSIVLSMNLLGEKVVSPSYSSAMLAPPQINFDSDCWISFCPFYQLCPFNCSPQAT